MTTIQSQKYTVSKHGLCERDRYAQQASPVELEITVAPGLNGWVNVMVTAERANGPATARFGYHATQKRWARGMTPPQEIIEAAIEQGLVI